MTFTNVAGDQRQILESFQQIHVDDQLALLWFFYTEMRGSIKPESRDTGTGLSIAQGVVDQIEQMPREQQLQVQRDILTGQGQQPLVQTYGGFNSSNRLALWYLLAQRMENGRVIPMPENYDLSREAQELQQHFCQLDFNDQVTLMRNLVAGIGAHPLSGAMA